MKHREREIDLSAFAFYQGSQGMPLDEILREISATHDEKRAALREESTHRQKPLEAMVQRLERQRTRVDAAWAEARRRLGDHAPSVFSASLIAVLGLAALVVDAILLGPGLDAVGISDQVLQMAAAFGLAALSSLIFHLAHETFTHARMAEPAKIAWRILGGVAIFALLSWGILRGYEVQFGAAVNQNPLGTFLAQHPLLASIFFCFVTLAAPFAGAAALHYAVPRIHDLDVWRRAKAEHEGLHTELDSAIKKLEAEIEFLSHRIDRLNAQEQDWLSVAAQYHQRGRQSGARQTPHWLVLLKSTAWSVGGLVLGCLLGPFLAPLYFALPGGAWIAAFLYYRHRRFHPTYTQFKQQENTRFAVSTDRVRVSLPSTPKLLSPPEDQI